MIGSNEVITNDKFLQDLKSDRETRFNAESLNNNDVSNKATIGIAPALSNEIEGLNPNSANLGSLYLIV